MCDLTTPAQKKKTLTPTLSREGGRGGERS